MNHPQNTRETPQHADCANPIHVADTQTPALEITDQVATIELRRVSQKNRLQDEDIETIVRHIDTVNQDTNIRLLVLCAQVSQPRPVFSAGYNLNDFEIDSGCLQGRMSSLSRFEAMVDALENARPPTLCALSGEIYGGAIDLVLACDYVIASTQARLRMPACELGFHYYPNGLLRFISRVGVGATKRAFFTASHFNSRELLEHGFVHELIDAERMCERVSEVTQCMVSHPPQSLQLLKQSINEIARSDFDYRGLQIRQLQTELSETFRNRRREFIDNPMTRRTQEA